MVTEVKTGQENESHLLHQLAYERKNADTINESLMKSEALLKKFIDKNEEIGQENSKLSGTVRQ